MIMDSFDGQAGWAWVQTRDGKTIAGYCKFVSKGLIRINVPRPSGDTRRGEEVFLPRRMVALMHACSEQHAAKIAYPMHFEPPLRYVKVENGKLSPLSAEVRASEWEGQIKRLVEQHPIAIELVTDGTRFDCRIEVGKTMPHVFTATAPATQPLHALAYALETAEQGMGTEPGHG